MDIASGSYTGNATGARAFTGLGFAPLFLQIKGRTGSRDMVITMDSMGSNVTKSVAGGATFSGAITSLDADGFTLGTHTTVNASTIVYDWQAIGGAGLVEQSTYVGDGAVLGHPITGVGFAPDLGIFTSTEASGLSTEVTWGGRKFLANDPSGGAIVFDAPSLTYQAIDSWDTDGFTVGASDEINDSGVTFHYLVWQESEIAYATTYVGNGADNRNIAGIPFQPDNMWVRNIGQTTVTIFRPKAMVGDSSIALPGFDAPDANQIQAFLSDGFQVGNTAHVNSNTYKHWAVLFKDGSAASEVIDPPPGGADVTARIIELGDRQYIRTARGRAEGRSLATPENGYMDFTVDDKDGTFQYANDVTGRDVRLTAFWTSGQRATYEVRVAVESALLPPTGNPDEYPLWQGYVEDIDYRSLTTVRPIASFHNMGRLGLLLQPIATELFIGLFTLDVAVNHVLDAAGWPEADRIIDPSITDIRYFWGDGQRTALDYIAALSATEGPGSSYSVDGAGNFIFRNGQARWSSTRSTTPQAVIEDEPASDPSMKDSVFTPARRDVINTAQIRIPIRLVAAVDEVIFDGTGQQLFLFAGTTGVLRARSTLGPAIDVNTASYDVVYGSITSATINRNSGEVFDISFTAGPVDTLIENFELTGKPTHILSEYQLANTVDASSSITRYGEHPWEPAVAPWAEIDLATGLDLINTVVTRYQNERPTIVLSFLANKSETSMETALTLRELDRITVNRTDIRVSGDYWVERIEHYISVQRIHTTRITCELATLVDPTQTDQRETQFWATNFIGSSAGSFAALTGAATGTHGTAGAGAGSFAPLTGDASGTHSALTMEIASGSFTGNATGGRTFSGLGFTPLFVQIKARNFGGGGADMAFTMASMGADVSKSVAGGATFSGAFTSLDADGFTLGTHATVNASGVTYDWHAIGGGGVVKQFTWVGNGSAGHAITGAGFAPDLAIICSTSSEVTWGGKKFLTSDPSGGAIIFNQPSLTYYAIQSWDGDGLTLDSSANVNGNGVTFHALLWQESAITYSMTYTGNGADNRNITGVGFQPDNMWVRNVGQTTWTTFKAKGQTGDAACALPNGDQDVNLIQAFLSDGFQVGSNAFTNSNTYTHWAVLFKDGSA